MKGKHNPPSRRNITRMDYVKTHGWWVRIVRRKQETSKLFSDRVHGGKGKALKAAQAWRDAIKDCLPSHIKHAHASFWLNPPSHNTSGRVGVFYTEWERYRTNGRYDSWSGWIAAWREDKRPKVARFSIANYGYQQAKRLAIAAREEAERRLSDAA